MTYKEYVKAFTFLFLAIKPVKNNMLKRTSELVQANIAIQKSNFDITKAYSMVEVNASIGVKTTFFSAFVANTNAQNETTYTVDLTKIGADRQTIKYTGIYGY